MNIKRNASLTLLALLLLGSFAQGQVALLPVIRSCFYDQNAKPLAGGKLYAYAAGTSAPQSTYTDSTGVTPNPNPVILDSAGCAGVWLSALFYKFSLQDLNNVVQYTVDNVNSLNLLVAGSILHSPVIDNESVSGSSSYTGTQTFSGTNTFNSVFIRTSGGGSSQLLSTTASNGVTYSFPAAQNSGVGGTLLTTLSDGTGIKHKRTTGCATGATAGNLCLTTVTWGTAFADANYSVSCVLEGTASLGHLGNTGTILAGSFQINTVTDTNAVITGVVDCIGLHD
jgi:hypothetical protein